MQESKMIYSLETKLLSFPRARHEPRQLDTSCRKSCQAKEQYRAQIPSLGDPAFGRGRSFLLSRPVESPMTRGKARLPNLLTTLVSDQLRPSSSLRSFLPLTQCPRESRCKCRWYSKSTTLTRNTNSPTKMNQQNNHRNS